MPSIKFILMKDYKKRANTYWFEKIISSMAGVEDILLVEGEDLAYVKVDPKSVDMANLQPYFNRK